MALAGWILFAYARDERPWGGADPPGVTYLYAPDRKAEQPIRHLQGFTGVLQVDGYAGYKTLAGKNAVSLAFCWSHVRRKFYDLAQGGPAPIASEALLRIAELYRIESDVRGHSAEERRDIRQARSRPIVEALEPWLHAKLLLVSQKSKLAEANRASSVLRQSKTLQLPCNVTLQLEAISPLADREYLHAEGVALTADTLPDISMPPEADVLVRCTFDFAKSPLAAAA